MQSCHLVLCRCKQIMISSHDIWMMNNLTTECLTMGLSLVFDCLVILTEVYQLRCKIFASSTTKSSPNDSHTVTAR